MTRPRIVLLNGPPRVGKDTIARHLLAHLPGLRQGFADELKARTHEALGLDAEPFARFEAVKDVPLPEFGGFTPREAYIRFSEYFAKPILGPRIFGMWWLQRWRRGAPAAPLVVIPDGGFREEPEPLAEEFGREALLLVRLHGAARGKTFAGDSRSHIGLAGVETVDVETGPEGAKIAAGDAVLRHVRAWAGLA